MPPDRPPMTDAPGPELDTAAPSSSSAGAPREPRPGRYPSTALALIGAVLGCLVLVAVLFLVVVRPDNTPPRSVDWHAAITDLGSEAPSGIVDPTLPDGWTANRAEYEDIEDTMTWAVGFISPAQGFVALKQGFLPVSDEWAATQLATAGGDATAGSVEIGGLRWTTLDRRAARDPGNYAYIMTTELDGSTIVLHGTATDEDFHTLAEAVATEARVR